MTLKRTLKWLGLLLLVALGLIIYKLFAPAIGLLTAGQINKIGLSPNELAANGPLPGEVSLYQQELACSQQLPTPGYYPTLNGAEIADAQRSGVFPCARFTGSHEGNNQVYAWQSVDSYPGISYINNRKPGELYIVGGEYPTLKDLVPAGPYIAKADATTGKEIWRTYVDNPNASGRWIGNANLNILENGNIPFSWSNQIVLLDGDSGEILKHNTLPSGPAAAEDVNFKHLTIAPDGTLILKDQTRPAGCQGQGTMAILKCVDQGLMPKSSVVVAVDPDSLEILDQLALPEPAVSPHNIVEFEGKITIYIGMATRVGRAFWDPASKKLSLDESWQAFPMQEGQGAATAPTIVGDWVGFQLNGIGSSVKASSVVLINQHDASKMVTHFPFGELEEGQWSWAPPKMGGDAENHMVYSADVGIGKVAGIKFDPQTGAMQNAFIVNNSTSTFQPVIGPKDQRVLLLTHMKLNAPNEPLKMAMFTSNYTEQLKWHDAATGEVLAESDFFAPLTINSLTPPGFGGRVYFPSAVGEYFKVLQVLPKRSEP